MNEPLKVLKELVNFIEENDIKDEVCDDGGGHTDEWRSNEFDSLLSQAKEVIKEGDETWSEFMDRAKKNGLSPTTQEELDKQD